MADYYGVSVRELLDGERVQAETVQDAEETVLKLAEYSNEDKRKVARNMHLMFIGGLIAGVLYLVLYLNDLENNFWGGLCQGIMAGMMLVGVIMTSKYANRLREYKMKHFS